MMNIYLVKRVDEVDYDEHDAAVIAAEDETSARAIASSKLWPPGNVWDKATCEVVGTTEQQPGMILASFCAG